GAPARMAVRTLPPAVTTPRAANWADPAKTRIDIRTTDHPGRWAATANTPKEMPKTSTAMAIGAADCRMWRTGRAAGIAAIKEESDPTLPSPAGGGGKFGGGSGGGYATGATRPGLSPA